MNQIRLSRFLSIVLLAIALVGFPASHVSAGGALIVTMVNEGADANPGDGFCATSGGHCTLRAAIQEANAHVGAETIAFNLPGGGVHVMSITSGPLPIITGPLILDGTSQPNCTVPCIVLSGAVLGGSNDGLSIQANNTLIKGFIITSWGGSGINVIIGTGNKIQHNDIGFWPGNPAPLGNGQGIVVNLSASHTTIGGSTAATRNVISRNNGSGIVLDGGATTVQGNYIGTNAAGTGALGNSADGISLYADASNNKIGGTAAGTGNRIAYNAGAGIAINDISNVHPIRNVIRHNSIFSNGGLGIDLGSDGVTLNDIMDTDIGANEQQNYPTLTSARSSTRIIAGQLKSKANKIYALDFFSSATCDPSLHGEGKNFIGAFNVTTNAMGVVNFSHVVAGSFPVGFKITATATDPTGNTSEFSVCRASN